MFHVTPSRYGKRWSWTTKMANFTRTVADSYDAMITERPYRPALAPERAAGEIKKNLGTQFDPQWGEIFLELFYSGSIG